MQNYVPSFYEDVKRYRTHMLIHSYIYYVLDEALISDHEWQRRANKLVALQRDPYPYIGFYDAAFLDWDGSTGYHLPKDKWVKDKAAYLLKWFKPMS